MTNQPFDKTPPAAAQKAQRMWGRRPTLTVPITVNGKRIKWKVSPPEWVDPYIQIAVEGDLEDDLTLDDLDPKVPGYADPPAAEEPKVRFIDNIKRLRPLIAMVILMVILMAAAPACDINWTGAGNDPSECLEFERTTDEVTRKFLIEIDVSRSAENLWPQLIDQAVAFVESQVFSEPDNPASIQVIAQSSSVMTDPEKQLIPTLSTNFKPDGNDAELDDALESCRQWFKDELTQRLDGYPADGDGSDVFGGITYASTQFQNPNIEYFLVQLGDGYSTASGTCDLNQASLSDPDAYEELARRCIGGNLPAFGDNVQAFMGGVGLRGGPNPGPGGGVRATDLIAFYRDGVWPLTGIEHPTVQQDLSEAA